VAGGPMVSVEASGAELTRFWNIDQWMVLNPGSSLTTVLDPAEVRFLPHGPLNGFPLDHSVEVHTPAPDPQRDGRLAALGATVVEITSIRLAVMMAKASGSTQLVAAVAVSEAPRMAAALSQMAAAAAAVGVHGMLAIPDTGENPLLASIRRDGRLVYRRQFASAPGPTWTP